MPQADNILTVTFDAPPTGFLAEASPAKAADAVDNAHIRLQMLIDTFFLVRQADEIEQLSTVTQNALMAIETGMRDVSDLLNIVPTARAK